MRVLILSSLFPPYAPGGSEISAWQHAQWLRDQGHDVGIWTTAASPEDQLDATGESGFTIWRTWMPRPYPMQKIGRSSVSARTLWHLQDHADPRNVAMMRNILDQFRPDMVVIHLLVGLGWNVLAEIGKRDIPVVFALHDLVLACLRSAMFRDGHPCVRQCSDCRLSSTWKMRMLARVPRLGFYSPSASNLNKLEIYVTLGMHIRRICANPIVYPQTLRIDRPSTDALRLLFVGRLHASKGLHILLEAAERLNTASKITVSVAGDGAEMTSLLERFGHHSWLTFHGFVSQEEVALLMGCHHVLCVPSIWNENAPGVIVQALGAGLPIVASAAGGIPELVGNEGAAMLVPPGDVSAWTAALECLIDNRDILGAMSDAALRSSERFRPDRAGAELYRLMLDVRGGADMSSSQATTGK